MYLLAVESKLGIFLYNDKRLDYKITLILISKYQLLKYKIRRSMLNSKFTQYDRHFFQLLYQHALETI